MNSQKRAAIDRVAEKIRQVCGVTTPVNMAKLVKSLGGKLEEKSGLDYEAQITRIGDSFVITLELQKPSKRKSFSIAHEVGHLVLHMGFLLNEQLWKESDQFTDSVYYRSGHTEEEREADEFAAALLMPKDEFLKITNKHLTGRGYNISKIATYFQVSEDAALTRGRWLGIFRWE
jgi:Zn-dependent peptidase ImmA (M78 family)